MDHVQKNPAMIQSEYESVILNGPRYESKTIQSKFNPLTTLDGNTVVHHRLKIKTNVLFLRIFSILQFKFMKGTQFY